MERGEPPYLRIVAEIRRRIGVGELSPGDRIPSTRQIVREWGVAMATASKAIAALRDEGLVRAVPGVGTVVVGHEWDESRFEPRAAGSVAWADRGTTFGIGARRPIPELTRGRILRAAIRIADSEGLAAVSMRRIATELGASAMSLYRHVRSKEELVHLMADAAYGEEPLPAKPPPGWRAQLEVSLRLQWHLYRRHPWLAQAIPLMRPEFVRNGMAHTEWLLRAIDGLGLSPNAMLHASVTLASFVRGVATSLDAETQARAETDVTDDDWMRAREGRLADVLSSGGFPTMARVIVQPGLDMDLDSLFEFGLRRQLDGLAVLVTRAAQGRRD
ncbi:TetR/AcrR family transcriptional regulator C-terminal domain-containing protein [Nonomuraea rhizosphaerae]|uniref:TetR/AcrR family transcriptional regulator C-terminal domain-containing protein n=1 Tax=Nonomuraea rhizosphaerae TaxID=2665663 RepID=UPI0027E277D9|nr:TetR/AcrR family transcriptional regulator C-terminal domain-containing protein [Nonomuraea rhizosphaerae]